MDHAGILSPLDIHGKRNKAYRAEKLYIFKLRLPSLSLFSRNACNCLDREACYVGNSRKMLQRMEKNEAEVHL